MRPRLCPRDNMMGQGLFAGVGVPLRFIGVGSIYAYGARSLRSSHREGQWVEPLTLALTYGCVVHWIIAVLVFNKKWAWLIGKDLRRGTLPLWSWLVWWPFHFTNRFFARLARNCRGVEAATEIYPGFYVGGWYSFTLGIEWAAVVDLCCELPEKCKSRKYLACPTWDGCVKLNDLSHAARFLAENAKHGPVLVHCAHGVGRSTTVMTAALVEAGYFQDTDTAFLQIKKKRSVAKQSPHFRRCLAEWSKRRDLDKIPGAV